VEEVMISEWILTSLIPLPRGSK